MISSGRLKRVAATTVFIHTLVKLNGFRLGKAFSVSSYELFDVQEMRPDASSGGK